MTAFHEIQFPPDISLGASGGPGFHTTITTLASGAESRNIDWAKVRGEWDVAHALKTQAQLNGLLKFFYARRGRAYGFRFKDWSDYQLPFWINTPGDLDALPVLFTTDGSTATFQLVKAYDDGAGAYTRTITKPVAGTLVLYRDGTPTTDFTVDTTTGIVTVGDAASTGHVYTGHCEFDVPVRFDVDDMKNSINDIDNFSWGQITILELKV